MDGGESSKLIDKSRAFLNTKLIPALQKPRFLHHIIAALAALIIISWLFGTFAQPTVEIHDTYLLGTLTLDRPVMIPVKNADVRLNSGDVILVHIGSKTLNTSGSIAVEGFTGKARWNGEELILIGTMEKLRGATLDITWEQKERAEIAFTTGIIDIQNITLSSFKTRATGTATLEERYTALLNDTKFVLDDFEGRIYVQNIQDQTTMGLQGNVQEMRIGAENILKLIS